MKHLLYCLYLLIALGAGTVLGCIQQSTPPPEPPLIATPVKWLQLDNGLSQPPTSKGALGDEDFLIDLKPKSEFFEVEREGSTPHYIYQGPVIFRSTTCRYTIFQNEVELRTDVFNESITLSPGKYSVTLQKIDGGQPTTEVRKILITVEP